MSAITSNKIAKIYMRVKPRDKVSLVNAAKFNNLSLTDYIISTCLKQAENDLALNKFLFLNNNQMESVMNLLNNPPTPTQDLINLFNKHDKVH